MNDVSSMVLKSFISEGSVTEINISLQDVAADVNPSEMQLLRTYMLTHSEFNFNEWTRFRSVDLAKEIRKILPTLCLNSVMILLRTNPDLLYVFLDYFDKSQECRLHPKSYLPFLCQWSHLLPPQWIVSHVMRIVDVRYANQLIQSYMSGPNYAFIPPSLITPSTQETWNDMKRSSNYSFKKLVDVKTAIQEIMEFKFSVKLNDYVKMDKSEFMKSLLCQCPSFKRAEDFIKLTMIPYCTKKDIDYEAIVCATVFRFQWDTDSKLELARSFVNKTRAIENITITNFNDLNKIIEFAREYQVDVNQSRLLYAVASTRSRSNSQERKPVKQKLKRTLSSAVIDVVNTIDTSVNPLDIMNGAPKNPSEYASKLSKYSQFPIFRPIFLLADKYKMVVSYQEFVANKKKIYDQLQPDNEVIRKSEIIEYERKEWNGDLVDLYGLDIDPDELNADPRTALFSVLNYNNYFRVISIANLFSIHPDDVIIELMTNRMKSNMFYPYQKLIPLLKRKESLQPILNGVVERLAPRELVKFYTSLNLIDKANKCQTIIELKKYNVPWNDDPFVLINDLYASSDDWPVHDLVERIAKRANASAYKIREQIISSWLMNEPKFDVPESDSVFDETVEEAVTKSDRVDIQKVIFILQSFTHRNAIKWLLKFIYQDELGTLRAKSKAFICIFSMAAIDEIQDVFKGDMTELLERRIITILASRAELFGVKCRFSEFVPYILNLGPKCSSGLAAIELTYLLEFGCDDQGLVVQLLGKIKEKRMKFLLQNFKKIFDLFDLYSTPQAVDIFVETVSRPFSELIEKRPNTKPFKSHHLSVIRMAFDAMAVCAINFEFMVINGVDTKITDVASMLIDAGYISIAAELGAHFPSFETRCAVMDVLLEKQHFDECITHGYNQEMIFRHITKMSIVPATEIMSDESFVAYTLWLKKHKNTEALEVVKDTLLKQGRTMEIKRLEERLSAN